MGERAGYVLRIEPPVEADRDVDALHDGGGTGLEPAAPSQVAIVLMLLGHGRAAPGPS